MTRVSESTKLYVPADRPWAVIRDFHALDRWHPLAQRCEASFEGTARVRKVEVGADAPLIERLEELDDDSMSQSYALVSGPIPVRDYLAVIRVKADDATSCTIEWSSTFEPDGVSEEDAVATIQNIYRQGLDHLRFTLGG